VVDAGGLGRASAEGCDQPVDGVSPFRMRDVYAFFVARCGVGEVEGVVDLRCGHPPACSDAQDYASEIDELIDQGRSSLGTVRKGSALHLLIEVLPGASLMTAIPPPGSSAAPKSQPAS